MKAAEELTLLRLGTGQLPEPVLALACEAARGLSWGSARGWTKLPAAGGTWGGWASADRLRILGRGLGLGRGGKDELAIGPDRIVGG